MGRPAGRAAATHARRSRDGSHLVSAGEDTLLKIWDLSSGRPTEVTVHSVRARDAARARAQRAATAGDAALPLRDGLPLTSSPWPLSGCTVRSQGHLAGITCACFLPGGGNAKVVSCSSDRQVRSPAPPTPPARSARAGAFALPLSPNPRKMRRAGASRSVLAGARRGPAQGSRQVLCGAPGRREGRGARRRRYAHPPTHPPFGFPPATQRRSDLRTRAPTLRLKAAQALTSSVRMN